MAELLPMHEPGATAADALLSGRHVAVAVQGLGRFAFRLKRRLAMTEINLISMGTQ
jgi:hypothetical protein